MNAPRSAGFASKPSGVRTNAGGQGVDVSIELVCTAATMAQAVRCLGVLGRAAIVALSREALWSLVTGHWSPGHWSLAPRHFPKITFPGSALRFVDLDATQNLS